MSRHNPYIEESNYRNDHRTRAGEEYDENHAGFDEQRMVIRLELPECDKPCCTPPYSYRWHRSEWDYNTGRTSGICGFEFKRGEPDWMRDGRVEEQSHCLTYFDAETETVQGLGPLGFGTSDAVRRLVDVLNADWKPAEHPTHVDLPAKFEVCPTCEGRGQHVNPSIDSSGLTREDFDEDPDFREEYFSGAYDVTCYGCQGRRVVPVVDTDNQERWSDDQKRAVEYRDECARGRTELAAEYAAERRMGA